MREDNEPKLTVLPRLGTFFVIQLDGYDDDGEKKKTKLQLRLEKAHPFEIVAKDTKTDRLYVYSSVSEFEYATGCTPAEGLLQGAADELEGLRVGETFNYDGRQYILQSAEPARQVGRRIIAVNNVNSKDTAVWNNMDPLHFSLIVGRKLLLQ